jgi:hypothetical protein
MDATNVIPPVVALSASDPRIRLVTHDVMPRAPIVASKPNARYKAVVSFVVDTLGNVDPHSGVVVSSTSWEWAVEICRSLPRTRYQPIRDNGGLVRARLVQAYEYRS